jgi:two-component system sensor histidine kinase ArlS
LKEDKIPVQELLQDVYDEISIRLQDRNISLALLVIEDVELINVNKFLLIQPAFQPYQQRHKIQPARW